MEQQIAAAQPKLKARYTLAISAIAHGSQQVEIRREGFLVWRGWEFEHGFESDFSRELSMATVADAVLNEAFTACGQVVRIFEADGSPQEGPVERVTCKHCLRLLSRA